VTAHPFEHRFWPCVDQNGPVHPVLGTRCWVWTGPLTGDGYGRIRQKPHDHKAHRIGWHLRFGAIPDGLCALHRCDNRRCVNPDHLFLGTRPDNSADMVAKRRSTRGERNPAARLRTADVIAIRRQLVGGVRTRELAASYGVSPQTIRRLRGRRFWPDAI
jgi:hypothetical protein